ncbi:kinase-associated protein B [Scopulibacillus daqui]|uniref:Kinase-associated protein B n=1 Tax=Scopulibacillus daqui TaxID=1469162 RepID=A0ABS2Q334_9BACL|nr:sporulation phosphorelay system protein KapB [Scopulibacillus daqui]MBM7646709.1 kinase-associated protein B [Scopulibacillus daqui]
MKPNDIVTTRYKTGEYIAKFIEQRDEKRAVVEIQAVLRHPTQGDLHQPNQVDVPLFHQRKALAFREKAVVQIHSLKPFQGAVPDYKSSLRKSLDEAYERLEQRDDSWAEKAKENLKDLEKDYFK